MAAGTVIDTGETFRIRNDHPTEPLVLEHGKRKFRIEPGKSGLVPFEIIRVWWGDPRAREGRYEKFADSYEAGYVNMREKEITRLGILYGTYSTDVGQLNDPEWPVGDARRGIVPKRIPWPVTVTTEAGERIVPAGLDLTGEDIYPAVRAESEDLNDEVQYRDHLTSRIDQLTEKLRKLEGLGEVDDTEVDAPAHR